MNPHNPIITLPIEPFFPPTTTTAPPPPTTTTSTSTSRYSVITIPREPDFTCTSTSTTSTSATSTTHIQPIRIAIIDDVDSQSQSPPAHTHTHTHAHTQKYIHDDVPALVRLPPRQALAQLEEFRHHTPTTPTRTQSHAHIHMTSSPTHATPLHHAIDADMEDVDMIASPSQSPKLSIQQRRAQLRSQTHRLYATPKQNITTPQRTHTSTSTSPFTSPLSIQLDAFKFTPTKERSRSNSISPTSVVRKRTTSTSPSKSTSRSTFPSTSTFKPASSSVSKPTSTSKSTVKSEFTSASTSFRRRAVPDFVSRSTTGDHDHDGHSRYNKRSNFHCTKTKMRAQVHPARAAFLAAQQQLAPIVGLTFDPTAIPVKAPILGLTPTPAPSPGESICLRMRDVWLYVV